MAISDKKLQTLSAIDSMRRRGMDAPAIAGRLKGSIQAVELILAELAYRYEEEDTPYGYKFSAIHDELWDAYMEMRKADENAKEEKAERHRIMCQQMEGGMVLFGQKMRRYQISMDADGNARCALWLPPPSRGAPVQYMNEYEVEDFMQEVAEVARQMKKAGRRFA